MSKDIEFLPIFLMLPPENIVFLKAILESYEWLGELRTLDPLRGEVVVMALKSSHDELNRVLESIQDETGHRSIPAPESLAKDWLMSSESS